MNQVEKHSPVERFVRQTKRPDLYQLCDLFTCSIQNLRIVLSSELGNTLSLAIPIEEMFAWFVFKPINNKSASHEAVFAVAAC